MAIEIQKRLPLNGGFGVPDNLPPKKINRSKDYPEYLPINWEVVMNSNDPILELEKYRLKPVTIKVSIDPEVYRELGYISDKLNLGLGAQSMIKSAVEGFVDKYKHLIDGSITQVAIGVGHNSVRRIYVKIKLKSSVASLIGTPSIGGLCSVLGVTRQKLVQSAVNEFIKDLKK